MSQQPRDRIWTGVIVALSLAGAFRLLAPSLADPDLWGHVRFGLDTLAAGHVPRADRYSYLTAGVEWINHEWLAEVIFASVWRTFGTAGLTGLKLGVVAILVGLLYRRLARRMDALRGGLLLVLSCLLLAPGLLTVRPQMFTYLAYLLALLAIDAAERGSTRWLWALPPLFAVWINLHGGVLAGLGVLALWSGATTLSGWLLTRGRAAPAGPGAGRPAPGGPSLRAPGIPPGAALALLGLCAAALLLNPYGWRLPAFLLETATVPRPDITEWQPLDLRSPVGLVYLAYAGLALAALVRARRLPSAGVLAVVAANLVLPLTAVRHVQLFALAVPLLLADSLGELLGPRADGTEREPARDDAPAAARASGLRWPLLAAGGAAAAALVAGTVPTLGCVRLDPERSVALPTRSVELLASSGVRGNLAVYFDWGEYALWHLHPRILVGMDGRRETVYPDSIYEDDLAFRSGRGRWDAVLEDRPTDLALVPRDRPTFNLLALDEAWVAVYEDSLAGLFARAGDPRADRLRGTPVPDAPVDGRGLCFP